MKLLGFALIAKVRTRNNIATFMCVCSGSSVSCAGWQISYAAIAIGEGWGGPRLCGRGDLFSVSESFFRHLSGKVEV